MLSLFKKKENKKLPKILLEKLPLQSGDVLLITIPDKISETEFKAIETMVRQHIIPKFKDRNIQVLINSFSAMVQLLHPIQGKFEVKNERLAIITEDNL